MKTRIFGIALTICSLTSALGCTWPTSPEWGSAPPSWSDDVADEEPPPPIDEEPAGQDACPSVGGIAYQRPRPNVMLLVDRSGSMAEPGACAQQPCPSKWQQLLALGSYLEDVKQHARLGLSVFPSPGMDACGVSAGTMVPISEDPAVDELILETVSSIGPSGRTPIAQALDEVALYGGLSDPDRDNVVVLLTDGMPNCNCSGDLACEQEEAVAAVERLVNRTVPIKLDVVGFGAGAAAASETLSAMADAAGTALPGAVRHFQADDIEQLIARLYQIAADLAPCRFNLDEWPDPADLRVHLDDTTVDACENAPCGAGYTYDQDSGVVELHGATCAAIRDGQCHGVWFETNGDR